MELPSEWSLLANVEKTLLSKNLSLLEVHEAEACLGELMLSSSDKTSGLALSLFEQIELRRASLVGREVLLSQDIYRISSDVDSLRLQMPLLTFEEAAERIIELEKRIENLLLSTPSTHRLRDQIERSQREIEHLRFVFVFPQLDELERDSFQFNMTHYLTHIGNEMAATDSFEPFNKLSARQQDEVFKYVGYGATPEKLACGIQLYIHSLLSQAQCAESYFYGRPTADEQYLRLPDEIRNRVEMLEQFDVLRTEALMQSLDERIGE
ncbi:MAG: hypothetical protein JSS32_06305 [Verrucomicrobia bacterium]|nr:hypothetical protein [Verrucomicrobiota bacterium]